MHGTPTRRSRRVARRTHPALPRPVRPRDGGLAGGDPRAAHRTPRHPEWLRVGFEEAKNVDQRYDEVRHAGPMPDVALIALSSMGINDFKKAASMANPSRSYARRSEASSGSTRRWPNQSQAARTASSTTPDTSPSTSAVPTPCSRQSGTCSAGDRGRPSQCQPMNGGCDHSPTRTHCSLPRPVDRSETVDVDDGFGEGVGCLLRHIVTDLQSPVGVFARELVAVS